MRACVYMCVCVYVCGHRQYKHAHTHIHTHAFTHTHTHTHTLTCTHAHAHAHAHTHTHTHTHIHPHTYTHTHSCDDTSHIGTATVNGEDLFFQLFQFQIGPAKMHMHITCMINMLEIYTCTNVNTFVRSARVHVFVCNREKGEC